MPERQLPTLLSAPYSPTCSGGLGPGGLHSNSAGAMVSIGAGGRSVVCAIATMGAIKAQGQSGVLTRPSRVMRILYGFVSLEILMASSVLRPLFEPNDQEGGTYA
jgi:hypothetical protein